MLKMVLAQRQRAVICVDGLDESLPDHRTGLLKALREIIQELPNVRLFLTARAFIRSEVEKYFPDVDTISVTPTKEDVKILLKTKIDGDPEPDAMDDNLRDRIMKIIPEKVSEIFLLVSLTIEAILGETTIHRRKEKLKQMTSGRDVGDVYTATLDRIKAQKKDRARLGLEAIMWISHSKRRLRPEELCQALGIQPGSEYLNNENQPTIRTILSCGLGLITLDSSSATVRLVHFTLQEYILVNPTLFHSPHSMIAEVCLTYLNYSCIRGLSPALFSPPPTAPFLGYASFYWGYHARRETTKEVKQLALRLLEQFDTHVASTLLSSHYFNSYGYSHLAEEDIPHGFTGLHGAAFFGVQEIMIALLGIKDWDLNATDIHDSTVLLWAAREGHAGIVKMLLERNDVDPDRADDYGQTPFSLAIEYGREGTVGMLVERNDVDLNRARSDGTTPFSFAAGAGHEGIVALMLERNDIDLNRADWDGRTPFSWAAGHGNEGTVKVLLERNDIDPDRADSGGRTPLSWAAENGYAGTVRMLLERNDIDPDRADDYGRTPFSFAAGYGEEANGRILLERNNVNPDRADLDGRTPFSWAAKSGHEGIVKMLLKRNDIDPGRADKKGQTPFLRAAKGGHEGIVKILLERNDIDPERADLDGRTPFSLAVERGYVHVVKLLEERRNLIAKSTVMDESSRSIAMELPQPSEPPFKRIRLL